MQGPLAQFVALTCWGNAILRNEAGIDAVEFARSNIVFGFCESVRFLSLEGQGPDWQQIAYAEDPAEWLEHLESEGVTSLRLIHGSAGDAEIGDQKVAERMLVGFVGGGGRWLLEAVKSGSSDFWEGRWELGDRSRADRKIWRVSYGRIATGADSSVGGREDVAELTTALSRCLTAIGQFGRAHEYNNFAQAFEAGLEALTASPSDNTDPRLEFVPPGIEHLESRRLLAAVQAAWVFGGMGSWNDLSFDGEDQQRYESLSEEMYQLLNRATVAAANLG